MLRGIGNLHYFQRSTRRPLFDLEGAGADEIARPVGMVHEAVAVIVERPFQQVLGQGEPPAVRRILETRGKLERLVSIAQR